MITIYLFENIIQYKEKEEIKEFVLPKKAMKYGKIRNIPLFESSLKELIKKEKWVTLLKTKKITIILPLHYEEIDKEILTVLLNDLGIKNIATKKEINLYERKNNQIILNVHTNYVTLFHQRKGKITIQFYPKDIFNNIDNILKIIFQNYKKESTFYIFGSYSEIPFLVKKMNNNKCFYFKHTRTYLIEKYIP